MDRPSYSRNYSAGARRRRERRYLRGGVPMPGTLSPWPVVAIGLNGHPIKTLQYLLRARGHSVAVDGDFGPQTDAAVKAFQTSKGLTANGTVDSQTWGALIIQVQQG